MRVLFAILIGLIPYFGFAQSNMDCKNCCIANDISGEKYSRNKEPITVSEDGGKSGLNISIGLYQDMISIEVKSFGVDICTNEGSIIDLIFDDGTKLQFKTINESNCDGISRLLFNRSEKEKNELKVLYAKKISSIEVSTTEGYLERKFTSRNGNEFKTVIGCFDEILRKHGY